MPDKHQFTLKWLLVEVLLLAIMLALFRWVFMTALKDDSDTEFLSKLFVGLPLLIASAGAAIGNVFKRPGVGAIVASVLSGVGLGVAFILGLLT
jgi:uncharacterized membrane-anchored protein YitT (DUF2179 family)